MGELLSAFLDFFMQIFGILFGSLVKLFFGLLGYALISLAFAFSVFAAIAIAHKAYCKICSHIEAHEIKDFKLPR